MSIKLKYTLFITAIISFFVLGCNNKSLQGQEVTNAERYGFQVEPITGDGNCLFRAIADQLQCREIFKFPEASVEPHAILRRIAVEHINSNKDDFRPFITGDIEEIMKNLAKEGEWNGHYGDYAIPALSRALGINVIVIRVHADNITVYRVNNARGTIYLYYSGSHYESLHDSPGQSAAQKAALGEELNRADLIQYQPLRTLEALIQEAASAPEKAIYAK